METASPETKITTVRLPADLYWRFKETQSKRRVNYQTAISQAVQLWIDGIDQGAKPGRAIAKAAGGEWIERLQRIMQSGNRPAIETIKQQLLFFTDYVEHFAAARRKPRQESA